MPQTARAQRESQTPLGPASDKLPLLSAVQRCRDLAAAGGLTIATNGDWIGGQFQSDSISNTDAGQSWVSRYRCRPRAADPERHNEHERPEDGPTVPPVRRLDNLRRLSIPFDRPR